MGQSASSEQGHEGGRKRLEPVVKRFQGGFPAQCRAHEYDDNVDQLGVAKTRTTQADVFDKALEETLLLEVVREKRDFSEPYRDGRNRL
jgi:hypothetical protein